jgi:hypothetical protein
MSLPACQERILSRIENALRACEPRLASRFAIFTWLTRDEEIPRTEQLVPQTWLRHALTSAGRVFRFLSPAPGHAAAPRCGPTAGPRPGCGRWWCSRCC